MVAFQSWAEHISARKFFASSGATVDLPTGWLLARPPVMEEVRSWPWRSSGGESLQPRYSRHGRVQWSSSYDTGRDVIIASK